MNDQTNNVVPLHPGQSQPAPTGAELAGTVPIDDVDGLVRAVAHWHGQKVGMLEHFLQVPEGTEIEVDDPSNPGQKIDVPLTGVALLAFKAGLDLALMQFGKLPFVAEMENGDEGTQLGVDVDSGPEMTITHGDPQPVLPVNTDLSEGGHPD